MVIKLKLSKKYKNPNGQYPIVVSISKNQKHVDIPTGLFTDEKDYIDGKKGLWVKNNTEYAYIINNKLNTILSEYRSKIDQLGSAVNNMTAVDIKKYVLNAEIVNNHPTFIEYARRKQLKYSGQSATLMKHTIDLLEDYFKGRPMYFEDITAGVLQDIDAKWAETMSINTRGRYMRDIRTIFNRAIDDELTTCYPFRKFKIKQSVKKKYALPVDAIRVLANLEFSKTEQLKELARDVFMLSFYLCGANLKDIYNLTNENLKKGKISFVRTKIKRFEPESVEIALQPEAKEILQKYKGKHHLFSFAEKYKQYDTFIHNISRRIRDFREIIGFDDLTLYYARYTWATIAYNIGIDEKTISKSLGHQDTTVAGKFYILYDWSLTDRANRKVIDYVFAK